MDKRELTGLLEANLARQLDWIKSADSKASFTFALNTAMLGFLAAVAPKSAVAWTMAPAIFSAFAVFFCVLSQIFVSVTLFPRTSGPKSSLIYCSGVASRSADQFVKSMLSITLDAYLEDLSSQCHRNAEIATLKFAWVGRALLCLHVAVVPWVLALWSLYSATSH